MVSTIDQGYKLHGEQFDFVADDKSAYMLLIGGLGSGKTYAGAVKLINFVAGHPGCKAVIMGPTYEMIAEGTLSVLQEIAPEGFITYGPKRESISGGVLIRTANGSTIYVRSFDDPWLWVRVHHGHPSDRAACTIVERTDRLFAVGTGI